MTGAQATGIWAATLLDELVRAGLRVLVVAPGSRSTPLVLAAATDSRLRLVSHLDERSAGFFALGVGKATGRPAGVVTTSGTAVANLLPAVVEASQAGVPLLVLSADRPHRLRGADANQAIDQTHVFGRYVRHFVELSPPSIEPDAIRHLRAVADRVLADAMGSDPGPVHVNVPLAKPLQPDALDHLESAADGRADGAPLARIDQGLPSPSEGTVARWCELLGRAERPLIVAGYVTDSGRVGPALLRLGSAAGAPVLADPLSGARFGPASGAARATAYDLYLRDPEVAARLRPDLVLRFGASPTSSALARFLDANAGAVQAVASAEGRWKDHQALASEYFRGDPGRLALELTERLNPAVEPSGWERTWAAAEAAAEQGRAVDATWPTEACVVRRAAELASARGAGLFVSNSMPIRDLDAFAGGGEAPLEVWGNRGASGIDGIVSTAAGVAFGRQQPVVCVLGDLAMIHDMNGLLATREPGVAVTYVVVHNDGGGIFHALPIRDFEPHFTRYFATPHGLDFRHTADLYDLPYQEIASASDLDDALAGAGRAGESRLLVVRTDREANRLHRERAASAAVDAVARALSQDPQESDE